MVKLIFYFRDASKVKNIRKRLYFSTREYVHQLQRCKDISFVTVRVTLEDRPNGTSPNCLLGR